MDKYFYQIRGVILSSFEWEKFDNKRKTIIQTFTEDINNMNFLGELTYSSLGIVNGRIMIKDCVKPKKICVKLFSVTFCRHSGKKRRGTLS